MAQLKYEANNLSLIILKNKLNITDNNNIKGINNDELVTRINVFVHKICSELHLCYPDIYEWVDNKYIDLLIGRSKNRYGEDTSTRPFLIYIDPSNNFEIAGICLMKRTEHDQKIAMLYVSDRYSKNGIAQDMLLKSHSILDLDTCEPYIYVHEKVFRKYPHFPHVIIKCGYQYDSKKLEEGSNQFYFTMNKAYSSTLLRYKETIVSQNKNMTFGVIK